MWKDAHDLQDFYASGLGHVARRMITRCLRRLWPNVRGLRLLGLGYATPFLAPFVTEAERVLAVMPAAQGVQHWPTDRPGLTALADEADLPFADRSIDRVVIVHGLECAEPPRPMMREVWRVLTDDGRLIVVVPNRRSLWAQLERTPFGHGRPYSPTQLSNSLRQTLFTPSMAASALYVPPVAKRVILSSAPAWEEIGQRWFTAFAGVLVYEATKQIYAPIPPLTAKEAAAVPIATR